jgi:hypothetical protein
MKKTKFLQAIDTLKLYRRAELVDIEGRQVISDLYVDPLPEEHILRTVLRPSTTFLIGRKGTGKSTIFQRAQESLNSEKTSTWAYIDIKTLYESSTSEVVGKLPADVEGTLSLETLNKTLIFKSFILELIKEIKAQINQRISSSFWGQLKEAVTGSASEIFEHLDDLIEELEKDDYIDVTGFISKATQDDEVAVKKTTYGNGTKMDFSPSISIDLKSLTLDAALPSVEAKAIGELVSEIEQKRGQNYSKLFIRLFKIKDVILRIREILLLLKLKHLYIFIDDFSELPRREMEEVVDSILSPFNNWSDEFIKLKVAVYPGRLYAGDIDLSKVDQVYLDIYRAYGTDDVSGMEEKAVDFAQRLITRRIQYFCQDDPGVYFESDSPEFWQALFYACLGNPRILGYVLYYAYELNIIYNKKIGIKTIQDAARRYYEEKIDHYFRLNKFLHESFEERSSIYSLKELLEAIVKRAKELRHYRESRIMSGFAGRPPTSHFHVLADYDAVLSSLELNFFLTKYFEMKDRDGRNVSVYALNYGLCQQQTIAFGRPRGKREHRLYLIERIFDYSPIISSYIKVNQEIVCKECGHRHPHEMLGSIQAFDMLCPQCKKGECRVVNLSRKYEQLIREVSDDNLLPQTELGILKTLHDERKKMFAKEIAGELDCSYQLVGRRGRNLADRCLVLRGQNDKGRRYFKIDPRAEEVYFSGTSEDGMDFSIPQDAV